MGLVTPTAVPDLSRTAFRLRSSPPSRSGSAGAILGNKTASGTAIIAELGAEHLATGRPIVYTSADSVFQIAAHVGRGAARPAVRVVRDRPRAADGAARGGAGDRPTLHGPSRRRSSAPRIAATSPWNLRRRIYLDVLAEAGSPGARARQDQRDLRGQRGHQRSSRSAPTTRTWRRASSWLARPSRERELASTRACSSPTWWISTWCGAIATTWMASPAGLQAVDAALAGHRRRSAPRRSAASSRPTTGSTRPRSEHRPQPGVRAAAALPAAGAQPGGRLRGHRGRHRRDRLPPPWRRRAGGAGVTDAGTPIQALRPARGWRRYTPAVAPAVPGAPPLPGRVGPEEAADAAAWLAANLGAPPEVAVILGSGLLPERRARRRDRRRLRTTSRIGSPGRCPGIATCCRWRRTRAAASRYSRAGRTSTKAST